jgi:hypothetical protein
VPNHFTHDARLVPLLHRSREAAKECSPRRKPWVVCRKVGSAPEGRKKGHGAVTSTWALAKATQLINGAVAVDERTHAKIA